MYKLFLDDERDPARVYPREYVGDWIVCRSVAEALDVFSDLGWPEWISFDHDLGKDQPTGMDLAKWLVSRDIEVGDMPADFTYEVHSANPVGAANIRGLLDGYLRTRG